MYLKTQEGKIDTRFYNEWIMTNKLGGYSLGYGNLINKRKYNGLLIAADKYMNRVNLVTSIEEKVINKESYMYLDSNYYIDTMYPKGYRHLLKTWFYPYPAFIYSSQPISRNNLLTKEIALDNISNTVVVRYTNIGEGSIRLELRPKFSLRNHHYVNGDIDIKNYNYEIDDNIGFIQRQEIQAFCKIQYGKIKKDLIVFKNNYYPVESNRGYDSVEDLIAPFLVKVDLPKGESFCIVFSDKKKDLNRDCNIVFSQYQSLPVETDFPFKFQDGVVVRNSVEILQNIDNQDITDYKIDFRDYYKFLDYQKNLCKVEDDIIAGYPWFGAWGRDTMISLIGYLDDIDFYVKVLNKYGKLIKNGLLPNLVSESGIGTNYMTVDASLWYCVRSYQVFDKISISNKKEILKYVTKIVSRYFTGNDIPFSCDKDDYLINIPEDWSKSYTWMDAIVHEQAVTPRFGKPIEINGLWYNALVGLKYMIDSFPEGKEIFKNEKESDCFDFDDIKNILRKLSDSMKKFFINNVWADRIEKGVAITEIRPNFVIALSLPFSFIDEEAEIEGYKLAKHYLLSDFGLKSLADTSPMFRRKYIGKQKQRDLAYHQGTVWYWPLYYYAKLAVKVLKEGHLIKEELNKIINPTKEKLRVGNWYTIAEVWDGDKPNKPKGAPCQAWSIVAYCMIEKELEKYN